MLIARASSLQGGFPTAIIYVAVGFFIATVALYFNTAPMRFVKEAVVLTVIGGALAAGAVMLQVIAFERWNEQSALIIVICGLNPIVAVLVTLAQGKRFTPSQWLGMFCAVAAIVLIMGAGEKTVPK